MILFPTPQGGRTQLVPLGRWGLRRATWLCVRYGGQNEVLTARLEMQGLQQSVERVSKYLTKLEERMESLERKKKQ